MTVVSSKEFAIHQDKFLDLAQKEEVCIERGSNLFYLVSKMPFEKDVIFEPDEEFSNSISPAEFRKRVHEGIQKIFANK